MSDLFAAFGVNWKLLLTQAINFGILLLALWYFLYTPVLRLIDERRQKIAEGVQKAEAAERKLADAEGEGGEIVGAAVREAEGLVAAARGRADERASEIVGDAESRAAAILKDAQARAEEAKRQVMRQSEKEIARAAMLAAEKILREKV